MTPQVNAISSSEYRAHKNIKPENQYRNEAKQQQSIYFIPFEYEIR